MDKTRNTFTALKRLAAGFCIWLGAAAAFSAQTLAAGFAEMPSLSGETEGDVMDSWGDFSTLDGLLALAFGIVIVWRRRKREQAAKTARSNAMPGGDRALILR